MRLGRQPVGSDVSMIAPSTPVTTASPYSAASRSRRRTSISFSRSDSSSLGRSSSLQDQHANGRDVQATDGTYSRSGSFSQNETFSSDTRTAEDYYDHSRKLSREAAEVEERAKRLWAALLDSNRRSPRP